jgi:hypothetical protein
VKLDSNGNVLWNRSYYFGASSSITGLNKDSDGNIYSAGAWLNTSHFDWFVMKTDSEGYYTTSLALNSTFVMNSATAILLQKSASGSIFNSSVNSSAGCGLSINDTDSYTVRNTTFSSNYYGVCIDASSTANLFYYNNFTNNSLYHAFADAAGNFFNTTNGSSCGANCSRGNYWDGILSLKIYDTNSDGFGDYGPQYPYNSTNGGNVSSNINDWGPITNRTDYVIQPPVLFQPSDGAIITDSRNPLYGWHNPAHTLSDDVTYQIQVDDDPGFSSPAVDVADIAETTTDTYYWSSSSLDFSVDYFWHVRANDTYYVSEWSSVFNFSILPTVSCAQPVDEIEFGQMCIFANQTRCDNEGLGSHINDTLDNHPPPYLLENNGNLRSRGEIYSTSLWTSPTYRQMPSKYYQFMIGVDEASSYDWALDSAWVNMTNVSASAPESYYGWKWENVSDSFKLHIRLEVPTDEPAGVKYSTTYVTCEQNETY